MANPVDQLQSPPRQGAWVALGILSVHHIKTEDSAEWCTDCVLGTLQMAIYSAMKLTILHKTCM